MQLYFKPCTDFKHLFDKTNFHALEYRPWIGAFNVHLQGIVFVIMQKIYELLGKKRYHREILKLSDGGEIALDWLIHPNKKKYTESGRHIIVLVPGVNGDSEKMYAIAVHKACIARELDLVVINWRGMAGVPLKVSFCALKITF